VIRNERDANAHLSTSAALRADAIAQLQRLARVKARQSDARKRRFAARACWGGALVALALSCWPPVSLLGALMSVSLVACGVALEFD
jgi:hypothetical protein